MLIVVENLSVPRDRRVWQEALTLQRAGYRVSVICPQGVDRDREAFELREGVEIHRYAASPAAGGALSYLREYGVALWQTTSLVRRLARERRFHVVHACNPPDLLLLSALTLKRAGARLVFDHHDLVPELYEVRFGRDRGLVYRALQACERLSFSLADIVISTNESYREVALTRGRKEPGDVFVVRNAPDLARFRRAAPDPSLKRGRPHLLAYVGVMGPQDGVDHALRALAVLKEQRNDWHALFAGDGDALAELRGLADVLGLREHAEFTGWLDDEGVLRVLSTADVCLAPEPKNALNDVSTMIKVAEYMAMSCPVVAYDLRETRFSAGNAALFAEANDPVSFAERLEELLADPERRAAMGTAGRARVEESLSWERSERALLAAYERALARDSLGV